MRSKRELKKRPVRHSLSVPCQVVRLSDFRLVADRIENLSTWGVLVAPADPVMTGEKVVVSFMLPDDGRYIDAMATVTRVLHGRRPGDGTRKLGLQFDELSEYDRHLIRRALAGRPPAPPGPRPGRRAGVDLRALVA